MTAGVLRAARPADLHRPRHRGRPARPRRWPTSGSARTRPDRGHRRHPRGAVRGQRAGRRVRPPRRGGRRGTGPGPRLRADGAAGVGPAGDREVAAPEIRRHGQGDHPGPARRQRPAQVPPVVAAGILGIDWATPAEVAGTGTFKEAWTLAWQPELSVRLVEASVWGTTVAAAAARRLVDRADTLAALHCGDRRLHHRRPARGDDRTAGPAGPARRRHRRRFRPAGGAAGAGPCPAVRHGPRHRHRPRSPSSRRPCSPASAPDWPAALGGLDDDAAREIRGPLERTHEVVPLLPAGPARDGWYAALAQAGERHDLPPLLAGRIAPAAHGRRRDRLAPRPPTDCTRPFRWARRRPRRRSGQRVSPPVERCC